MANRTYEEKGLCDHSSLGLFKVDNGTWEEFDWLCDLLEHDGWEILALKVCFDGVWLFAKLIVEEFLD